MQKKRKSVEVQSSEVETPMSTSYNISIDNTVQNSRLKQVTPDINQLGTTAVVKSRQLIQKPVRKARKYTLP